MALVVMYFSFHAGGYFPGITGLVTAVLCLLVVARIATVDRPFGTLSRGFVIGASALALFALWTLFSGTWSDAPSRALVEYDRVLSTSPGSCSSARSAARAAGCAGWSGCSPRPPSSCACAG